ncbi:glycoside hydrolase family 3 domain protein [Chlorobaculum parvum NCIB 8327]|uniref:beta-N-acetylhexosaminidase n=1 Tax=Chlorobaculum parvum (strain DSM 263 / NCIMB 8327) TaxID=517417 RepID=B3QLQ1_CHLP8|nr:glycoside hydrolase family 3 N-terminal domain-containing protein [Chlorobaculum parvum]ACF12387.1 glycoside hydrolase family 3 domain protein [Chlorobaculum parvum NCIB 8327]
MKKSLLAALLLLLSFTTALAAPSTPDSLSIKIGQMLMVGFRGLDASSDPAFEKALRAGQIGGVVLFDYDVPSKSPVRNIESPKQVRRLTEELQSLAPMPLFIAVDQEGGRVCRLKPSRGFPPTVSAAYLGRLDNADSTRQAAGTTAKLLKSLGINMNLAPVVDLNVNPENPVIGKLDRSFSSNPAVVARQARIFVDTFHQQGIIAALKHFPGHGSSTTDTHKDFTDVTTTWSKTELEPYRTLIGNGYSDPVMTAHVFNAKLDSSYPATLSKATIDGLLRKQLGFRGVVISDDMQMKAIADRYGLEQAIRLAIDAGVDVLLFGNNVGIYDPEIAEKANAIIRRLVEKGDVTPERIDASYRRIIALKQRTITPAP